LISHSFVATVTWVGHYAMTFGTKYTIKQTNKTSKLQQHAMSMYIAKYASNQAATV